MSLYRNKLRSFVTTDYKMADSLDDCVSVCINVLETIAGNLQTYEVDGCVKVSVFE